MLTFSRKEGEYIILNIDDKKITIRLDRVEGRQAKVSIGAPDEVNIISDELLDPHLLEID